MLRQRGKTKKPLAAEPEGRQGMLMAQRQPGTSGAVCIVHAQHTCLPPEIRTATAAGTGDRLETCRAHSAAGNFIRTLDHACNTQGSRAANMFSSKRSCIVKGSAAWSAPAAATRYGSHAASIGSTAIKPYLQNKLIHAGVWRPRNAGLSGGAPERSACASRQRMRSSTL